MYFGWRGIELVQLVFGVESYLVSFLKMDEGDCVACSQRTAVGEDYQRLADGRLL